MVKVLFTPVSGQGGVPRDPNSEKYFPEWILRWMRATDKVIQKNQNTAKKSKIGHMVTKWRPKEQFQTRDIKFPTKNGKTTFPMEFFHKIWLIIGDCKYNYIAEIKIEKSYSVALLWEKQILKNALKMLIYAN